MSKPKRADLLKTEFSSCKPLIHSTRQHLLMGITTAIKTPLFSIPAIDFSGKITKISSWQSERGFFSLCPVPTIPQIHYARLHSPHGVQIL